MFDIFPEKKDFDTVRNEKIKAEKNKMGSED